MRKRVAVIAALLTVISMQSSHAATKITLSPQFKVSHKNPTLTFTFSGLPTTHGIYLQQCMAPGKNGIPTRCNPAETAKLWISNVPADIQQGATSGAGKVTMKIDPYFKKGDCIHTTCVIFATNDHQASQDRSEDQAIKFRFS
jgi:hypothetical protein